MAVAQEGSASVICADCRRQVRVGKGEAVYGKEGTMTPIPRRAGAVYDRYTDDMYPDEQRPPSSAIRWDRDTQGNQVIQRGRQRLVIHNVPPPKKRSIWLPLCLGMLLMVLLYLGGSWALNWWTNRQLDATYGMPRTYQTSAIVYPDDSASHPSHYEFMN